MSLGIFSFDLAAIINSLSNLVEIGEQETEPAIYEISLAKTEDVLQNATVAGSGIDDVLMSAVTSVISTAEIAGKDSADEKNAPSKPVARTSPVTLDEETRKEIERLIKSLQTSVIHNYKSTDIIDETVSLNNVANFPKGKLREDSDENSETAEQQKKMEEYKLELLRDELKKTILRSNSGV
jgi:hypothetical protein